MNTILIAKQELKLKIVFAFTNFVKYQSIRTIFDYSFWSYKLIFIERDDAEKISLDRLNKNTTTLVALLNQGMML